MNNEIHNHDQPQNNDETYRINSDLQDLGQQMTDEELQELARQTPLRTLSPSELTELSGSELDEFVSTFSAWDQPELPTPAPIHHTESDSKTVTAYDEDGNVIGSMFL